MTSPPLLPAGSDLHALATLLEGAGYVREIELKPDGEVADRQYRLTAGEQAFGAVWERRPYARACQWSIELSEGVGYNGFRCRFYFDESGKLLAHGVWE